MSKSSYIRKIISECNICIYIQQKNKNIKKARHPVGLFRIWLLDMTPVVSHAPGV
ncbi:hypothetical protein J658_0568 [Acinetobacter baumannii 573719]|nr:hypothetical protein J658_0568 [Acinetobacter baumannii 573719]